MDKSRRLYRRHNKKYDENDDYGAILEVDADYPKHLHKLHSDLPFLPERIKINKVDKLVCNVQNKRNYVVYIAALIFKKVHNMQIMISGKTSLN